MEMRGETVRAQRAAEAARHQFEKLASGGSGEESKNRGKNKAKTKGVPKKKSATSAAPGPLASKRPSKVRRP